MEETLCQEEMEPVRTVKDPKQEKDKAVASRETGAEGSVQVRAGVKAGVRERDRGKAGLKVKDRKEGRGKAKAGGGDRAVNKSFGTIDEPCTDPSR